MQRASDSSEVRNFKFAIQRPIRFHSRSYLWRQRNTGTTRTRRQRSWHYCWNSWPAHWFPQPRRNNNGQARSSLLGRGWWDVEDRVQRGYLKNILVHHESQSPKASVSFILSHNSWMDLGDLGEVSSQIQEICWYDKGQQRAHFENSRTLLHQSKLNWKINFHWLHHQTLSQRQERQSHYFLRN